MQNRLIGLPRHAEPIAKRDHTDGSHVALGIVEQCHLAEECALDEQCKQDLSRPGQSLRAA
eukprot:6511496-Prymnesium_polylepis.1